MERRPCCVTLSVQPSRGLVDEKFVVLVQKLQPGFQLTVHALHRCEAGHRWEAFAHYAANTSGTLLRIPVWVDHTVELNRWVYCGALDQLQAANLDSGGPNRIRRKNVQTPMTLTISVYKGHQTEGFVGQIPLASVLVERWYMAPGVRRIPITEGGLTATLFLPPGPGSFPGLLDLWGGGGNLVEYRAALLASRGFASLALDYLTHKSLQKTGRMVGMEYFEAAYKVLQQRPEIISSRVAVLGLSLGASVTLKLAAYSQVVQPRCAVCISGSHVQPVDGSVADIFAFCDKNASNIRFSEDEQLISRDLLLPIPTDPALKVDVGRLRCPLLVVVGEDDQNWAASESALDIKQMMERAGNGHLLTILSYPNAGHLIEPPYTPHTRTSIFTSLTSREKSMVLWGGESASHSRAQEDSWRKMVTFLRENLHGGRLPSHL